MMVIHASLPYILISTFLQAWCCRAEMGTKKIIIYHHRMYKDPALTLELLNGFDAVLELTVQSHIQIIVELLLQVNIPGTSKPKTIPTPERLCGGRAKHLQSVSYQYWGTLLSRSLQTQTSDKSQSSSLYVVP